MFESLLLTLTQVYRYERLDGFYLLMKAFEDEPG